MDIRFEQAAIRRPGFGLDLDLSIPAEGITAIIGPSGAGKSSLLDVIAGFLPLSAGRLLLGGAPAGDIPPARRPVTMVFQDNNLFGHLDVAQNVGLGLDPGLRLSPGQRAARDAVLAEVGLLELADRRPGALSGGQQSRAALARALLRNRPILLLDEPFAALGPGMRADMLDLVATLQRDRGMSVLMVTHDPADAQRIADRTMVVGEGRVLAPAPTGAVFENPDGMLRAYLGKPARPAR